MRRGTLKRRMLIVVGVLVLVAITSISFYSNYKDKSINEKRMEKLVEDARKREKELNELSDKGRHISEENKSNLTEEDIDLTDRMDREDVENHATTILGIVSDDSRLKAIETLPLTKNAQDKYFSNASNIYYGSNRDSASVEILFVGLDYTTSNEDYHANIICNVTYSNKGEVTDQETVSLVINYKNAKIDSWNY